jgi:hypothetical protein
MDTLEVLRSAREYIADGTRWVQGSMGDDGNYCAVGACFFVSDGWGHGDGWAVAQDVWAILNRAAGETTPHGSVQRVNDEMGHTAVLAVMDRAIAIEEAKAAEFTTTTREPVYA